VAGAALVVAALVGLVLLPPFRAPQDAPVTAPRRSPRPSVAGAPASATAPAPERNVFEYARPQSAAPEPAPRRAASPRPLPPAEVKDVDPVRLVGLVQRGGQVRAALSIHGEVVILAAGEEAEGYRVLAVEREGAVRLRRPDGSEATFVRPEG
jgi:hypothetical protein